MMKGKRMILEQGGGWDKTGRAVASKVGSVAETPFDALRGGRGEGSLRVRSRFRLGEAATSLRMMDSQEDAAQLFSLLARFQEISSPMVELVLDTGCL